MLRIKETCLEQKCFAIIQRFKPPAISGAPTGEQTSRPLLQQVLAAYRTCVCRTAYTFLVRAGHRCDMGDDRHFIGTVHGTSGTEAVGLACF